MAHYRTLIIDGKNYKVNIGKKFVEIRPEEGKKKIVKKEDIGIERYPGMIVVIPAMIADWIKNGVIKDVSEYFDTCSCDAPKIFTFLRFQAEIEDKEVLVNWCQKCLDKNSYRI